MDTSFCIITGIIFFVFVFFVVRAVVKYREGCDFGQVANAVVFLLCAIAPGFLFFFSFSQLTAPPVVTSCERFVTQEGDTLYEFQDATRYCRAHIDATDTTTVFVTRKEDVSLGLSRGDNCLYCHRPLREHSRTQRIDSGDEDLDWGWDTYPY